MPTIRMENVVSDKNHNKEKAKAVNNVKHANNNTNEFSYIDGLLETPAFSSKLSDIEGIAYKLLLILFRFLTLIIYSIIYVIKLIVFFVSYLCSKSKIAKWALIVFCALCVIGLIDYIAYYGKIYPGVYIGEIDFSNKTAEEAEKLIDENFSWRLTGNNVTIYSNEAAKNQGEDDDSNEIIEQLSIDEAKQTIKYWKTNSVELDASLPVSDILDTALNSNRGLDKFFVRLGALIFKQEIKPYANYNDDAINQAISKINDTIGKAVENPTCLIQDGEAVAVKGNDGKEIDKQEFVDDLNTAFFQNDQNNSNFVAKLHDKKQVISLQTAETLANVLNKDISRQVSFKYKDANWNVDKLNLAQWIKIDIDKVDQENKSNGCSCSALNNDLYLLKASIDSSKIGSDILENTKGQNSSSSGYSINFEKANNGIFVKTSGNFDMPNIQETTDALNTQLLGNAIIYENNNKEPVDVDETPLVIDVKSTNIPEMLSLKDAIDVGVVSTISTYTTTYSSGAGTENRNHNIALAASIINNSICQSDGGIWSFNETAGDCNAERGFLEAGSIVGNSYTKSVGGGICQVATTVFNAAYDGGFPIPTRYNHDLHIASYPAGRDAAINYPDLDLKWKNNDESDVLMQASSSGYSITVSLLGVNKEYSVKTEVGEWTPGEHYKTKNVVDPGKEPNSKFTQTSGSDGKSIMIKRFVYNKNGELVFSEEITSNYKPKTEIIVYGPGDEANKLLSEHNARMKNEEDDW